MYRLSQTTTFEAAHYINAPDTPDYYKRLHGHSFVVTAECAREELGDDGWVVDLKVLEDALREVVAGLDHQILNEVEGLEKPTFENILKWIADRLVARGLPLSKVTIARPTMGQSASYEC